MARLRLGATVTTVLLAAALAGCGGGGGDGDDDGSSTRPDGSSEGSTTTDAADAAAGPSGSFTALTYNVAGLPQGINADQFPEQNIPLISPLLDAYDLVLVQEDFAYTDLLRADIDHEHRSEPHPGPAVLNPIGREGVGVGDGLNVFSRFPFGELDRVPWTDCGVASGDCLALKGFAATTIELDDGVPLDVYTLHLEAGGDDAALRGADLDQLAARLADEDGAVILGGDWNLEYADDPDGEQLRGFLEETGLQDVCDVVDCGADDDVIDRFLFRSSDELTIEPTSHRFERDVFVDAAGAPLSDHDPLAVEWSWTVTDPDRPS